MKKYSIAKVFVLLLVLSVSFTSVYAQKRRRIPKSKPPVKAKSIVFAVVNDGAALEPIAFIENGKLSETANGSSNSSEISAFAKSYYQPKTTYDLIFGGKTDGKITVNKSSEESECAKNMAEVTTVANKAKIKGFVMGLATNAPAKIGPAVRRLPTYAERAEVETLVRSEFSKQKIASEVLKNLRYHNLTAVDIDNNGKIELIGSYWVENAPKERARLFFIAERNSAGKYTFTHSEYNLTKESDVMSSEISALDEGIYHELLVDLLDVDGDGVSEVFTIVKAFESNGFNVYKREGGKWVKSFEVSNYHCGY